VRALATSQEADATGNVSRKKQLKHKSFCTLEYWIFVVFVFVSEFIIFSFLPILVLVFVNGNHTGDKLWGYFPQLSIGIRVIRTLTII